LEQENSLSIDNVNHVTAMYNITIS